MANGCQSVNPLFSLASKNPLEDQHPLMADSNWIHSKTAQHLCFCYLICILHCANSFLLIGCNVPCTVYKTSVLACSYGY